MLEVILQCDQSAEASNLMTLKEKKSNKETKVNLIKKLLLVFLASKDKINKMK